jgi:hypothetical protein
MKTLLYTVLCLVFIIRIHAQSPTKSCFPIPPATTYDYTKPKAVADCSGWMTKTHISEKPCLPNQPWRLVFEDEFNGTQLDRNKWKSVGQCDTSGHIYNQEANLVFTGSTMKMQFKQQNILGYCPNYKISKNFNYTSGGIQTHTKFRHGFFEVRCKLPTGVGVNPSFWLYGDCSQEVDVFELLRKSNTVHGNYIYSNIHRDYDCEGSKGKCEHGYYTLFPSTYTDGNFHTFGFEWDAYKYEFYIDGCLTRRDYFAYKWRTTLVPAIVHDPNRGYDGPVKNCGDLNKLNDDYWVYKGFPTHTMRVILTLQKLKDDPSNNLQEFEIDYVRIWQKQNCDEDIKICDFYDYSQSHDHPHTYTHHDPVIAKTITFECGNSGTCNYQMDLIYGHESSRSYYATQQIDMLPGFDTGLAPDQGGSDAISHRFDAGIRPCPIAVPGKTEEEDYLTENQENELTEFDELEHDTEPEPILTDIPTDLEIYPNPSTNEVHIHIPDTKNSYFTLILTDIQMKTVKILESGTTQSQHVYNLQDIPSGMYFVQFISNHRKITKKLIKL